MRGGWSAAVLLMVSITILSGCSTWRTANADRSGDILPTPAAPTEIRDVSVLGEQTNVCVDAVGDAETIGADLDKVELSFEPSWIVLTYTFASITALERTQAVPVPSLTSIPDLLQLSTTLRPVGAREDFVPLYTNFTGSSLRLISFTPEQGRFEVAGEGEVLSPMSLRVKFPDTLLGSLPSEFEWSTSVLYSDNKRDPCINDEGWLQGSR